MTTVESTTETVTPVVSLPAVIYLRGAGCRQTTWHRVQRGVAERGWYGVSDHTTAWHLARGGCTTIELDFTSLSAGGLSRDDVTVQRVRARHADDGGYELVHLHGTRGGDLPRPVRYTDGSQVLDIDRLMRMVEEAML